MRASTKEKFQGLREDVLGAGLHLLSGAGSDVKVLLQQAVQRLLGEGFVRREEFDSLLARLEKLEAAVQKNRATAPASAAPKAKKKPVKSSGKA